MKIGSLFDGSGGFPLACAMYGGEPVWRSEVEPYPIAVTTSRFPDMVHLGDVSKINGAKVKPVDVITFGSPCQDLSVRGKRAGLKHEANGDEETTRSGLFMEAVRIIKEMRRRTNGIYPTFAVWENVPGAYSSNKGEDFRVVLEELARIKGGAEVSIPKPDKWRYAGCIEGDDWSIAWRTFDAQYWGVPQRRRRIYLVADFRGQRAAEILFEREGLRGYFEKGRTPWKSIATYTERGSGADDKCIVYCLQGNGIDRADTAGCNDKGWREDASYTLNTIDRPAVVYAFEPGAASRLGGYVNENITGTLRAEMGDNQVAVVYAVGNGQVNQPVGEIAGTPNCMHEQQAVVQKKGRYIVRRLTPTECARLQGFPDMWGHPDKKESLTDEEYSFWQEVRDTYADINGKQKKQYSRENMLKWYNKLHTDSSEYKMWGNGIALPNALYVMQGIARELAKEKDNV